MSIEVREIKSKKEINKFIFVLIVILNLNKPPCDKEYKVDQLEEEQ
jgi:hypothetical protein